MASTLPELCLHLILKELKRDWKAQYSCILINRHWCISSIPELWKDPFSSCSEFGQKERYIQLMNTYFNCLSQEFRESIGLDSATKVTFYYTSFLRFFWPNGILATIKVWLDTKILASKKKIVSMIFKSLCEDFMINSKYIEGIYFENEQIINIFELPQIEGILSNITYLNTTITGDKVGYLPTLLLSASKISKNIKKIVITWINDDTPLDLSLKNMTQIIKNQRRLEDISISCLDSDFPIIWGSVLEHLNVLTSLQLSLIQFNETEPFPLHELSIFSSLRQLEIIDCSNFKFSINEIDLSLSFKKLNEIVISTNEEFSLEFIEILLRQSNERLKELTLLFHKTKDIISYCKMYCTKLIKLDYSIDTEYFDLLLSCLDDLKYLEILSLSELIPQFTFQLTLPQFDGGNLLLLGQHLPKSTIDFTYDLDHDFHHNSLFEFFKICNEREIKFKVLNFSNCTFFDDDYIYLLLDYYGNGQLDELHLYRKKNFSKKCIDDVEKHVKLIKFSSDERYLLSDYEYNELY